MAYGCCFVSLNCLKSTFRLAQLNSGVITITRAMSTTSANIETIRPAGSPAAPGLLKVLEANPKRLKRIKFLASLFQTNGFELRIAGGAVRDILLGKEPQDIDFATTARPEQSLEILGKHEDLLRIIVTASGQRHGTVAAKFKEVEIDLKRIKLATTQDSQTITPANVDQKPKEPPEYDEESPYEITTLRCDTFTDGRHAEVEFISDWRKDAERRDLTINAMFLTLDDGKLIDYFGGESDLKNGSVRFVGDADLRIREDYLRILRFFRFWSRYGRNKHPDEETITKLQRNLDGLSRISGERIWQEIKKTLSYLPCVEVVELMLKLRLFDYAGLEEKGIEDYDAHCGVVLEDLKTVQQNVNSYLNDVLKPRPDCEDLNVKRIKDLLPVILFATLVRNEELCLNAYARMKFSNLERDTISYIIENRTKNPTINAFKYQMVMAKAPERSQTLQRIRAYCIGRGEFDFITELESWKVPEFPVSGITVSQLFKRRKLPGNKIKVVIDALKLEWARSDYKLSEEKLLELLNVKVDEVAEGKL